MQHLAVVGVCDCVCVCVGVGVGCVCVCVCLCLYASDVEREEIKRYSEIIY